MPTNILNVTFIPVAFEISVLLYAFFIPWRCWNSS